MVLSTGLYWHLSRRCFARQLWQRLLLGFTTGLLLCALCALPGWAQSDHSAPVARQLFAQLSDMLSEQPATSERSAPVRLNGRTLFQVAPTEGLSASDRAAEIQAILNRAARRGAMPSAVRWQMDSVSQQPILYLGDQFLMTITEADAKIRGFENLQIRADEVAASLRQGLTQFRQEHRPEFLQQQLRRAGLLLLLAIFASWVALLLLLRLNQQRQQYLPAPRPMNEDGSEPETPRQVITALRRRVFRGQRRGFIDLQRWLLYAAQAGIWFGYLFYSTGLFPQTRYWQPIISRLIELPVEIGLIAIAAYALIRICNVAVDRTLLAVQEEALLRANPSQRLALRVTTFSGVAKSILDSLIIATAGLVTLSRLGVNLAPLLTGAGIIGLALSLASQSLLKDLINGLFILVEDHYGVGDVIIVGEVAGFVENMNLRITQLRNEEGRLITIPNSAISVVQNLSKEWSRVDLMIPVSLEADIDQALALIEQVAEHLRCDPQWCELILEPPLLLGVDQLDHAGSTVRIWIKTAPLKQWDVAREYRRRLKIAFDRADIEIGIPQQSLQIRSA
ncbi:MAG: mechanosensitive ion channel family protein [Leptolyngbya sp. SIO4C1]|nr:mechanosensitive ion channel family protein [Leptolyngbya sp. SIO4C1]